MWLFGVEGREEVEVWPVALGQKCQDVMGSDPRPFLWLLELPRAIPAEELVPRTLPGGIQTPSISQGQVLQPSWMALQPRPAGTGRILTPGMLLGVLALPSFPAQLQGQCYSSALGAVP